MRIILIRLLVIGAIGSPILFGACGNDDADEPPVLMAPSLSAPTGVTASSFFVDWPFIEGADGYQIDVARDDTFTDFVEPYQGIRHNFSEFIVSDLEPATTYYVRVRSIARDLVPGNSNTVSATTINLIGSEPGSPPQRR